MLCDDVSDFIELGGVQPGDSRHDVSIGRFP